MAHANGKPFFFKLTFSVAASSFFSTKKETLGFSRVSSFSSYNTEYMLSSRKINMETQPPATEGTLDFPYR